MTLRRLILPAILASLALGATALAQTAARLARLNAEETQLTADQARDMNRFARLLSVLERLRRDPPPAFLVSPQNALDAVRAGILVRAMTPELQARARFLARSASEMARQRRLAAVESEALFTRESEAADASPPPQEPGLALRGLKGKAGPARAPERLLRPVPGAVIRRFGEPLVDGGRANGLTLAANRRAQVRSPDAGLVEYVGPVKGWGVILILRLSGGYHLVLAGLDRPSVTVGQSVAAGQAVGWMPDGGKSTSELYLELRDQGSPVDPTRWLGSPVG